MKKSPVLLRRFLLVLFALHLAIAAHAETRIGILTISAEPRYTQAAKAFKEELARNGFAEPEVVFLEENAQASKVKARAIVKKFAAARLDLILALGTSAAVVTTQEIKEIPVVFSVVFDPIGAGIARDWDSSGNNTTGSCTKVPMEKVFEALNELVPARRVAVFYTPGEKNSELQLKDLRDSAKDFHITVVPVILSHGDDLQETLPEVIKTVDAIFLTGSIIVGPLVPIIVEASCQAGVVTFTHLDDLVENGVLLGVCSASFQGGQMAGEKAIRILRGEKPDRIPIEIGRHFDWLLNRKTAARGGFSLPASFTARVSRFID